MLNLFALRASVGLIVLAPNPLARPLDMVLCLLFEVPEDGVTSLTLLPPPSPLTRGLPSVVSPRGGGCILRTLFARAWVLAVKGARRGRVSGARRGRVSGALTGGWRVVRRRGWLRLLVRERAGLRVEEMFSIGGV